MYPVRVLSLGKGWDLLTNNKPEEWESIKQVLSMITADVIIQPSAFLKENSDDHEGSEREESQLYEGYSEAEPDNAFFLRFVYDNIFGKKGWEESDLNKKVKSTIHLAGGQTKNKVLVYCLSNQFIAGQLNEIIYVLSPRAVALNEAEVIIVIVPDESVKKLFKVSRDENGHMGIGNPFVEDDCRARLGELSPIKNSAPMAFIFCSLHENELIVEELPIDSNSSVDRALVFPPEFYQAGVTVLSNFGNILKQKYPNINARVRIEQDGNTVRMHVSLPDGEVKVAEEVLDKYLKVVQEQEPPSALLDNPLQVAMLEQKLEMVKLELRSSASMYQLALRTNDTMRADHEQVVTNFQRIIGEQSEQLDRQDKQLDRQAGHIDSLIALSAQQNAVHGHVQMAQIGHTSTLFKDLLGEAQGSRAAVEAVQTLQRHLTASIAAVDAEDQIRAALSTIKEEKPSLLNHLAAQLESAGFGALGGVALEWLGKHTL
ncbi:hypothetical protein [Hymenobacter negativus]|uniref:Uncharacterized protein n=1 Tax=Hymenobacter negativus TaxID=2795026 RepID=A0ABS0QB68_9BACT|nr:hypothetical protein [Hymenobacter negativus]MBH8559860.1 hypothetical protein [Hymenobacter negativus]